MAISQGLVSALGIAAAILGGSLMRAWARNRRSVAVPDAHGWRHLRPVPIVYPLSLVFPTAFLILVWALLWRNDLETNAQWGIAAALLIFLGVGAIYSIWGVFGCHIRWNEKEVEQRRWFFPLRRWQISDVRSVSYNDSLGFRADFMNGSRLRFSNYENGASELAGLLRENSAMPGAQRPN